MRGRVVIVGVVVVVILLLFARVFVFIDVLKAPECAYNSEITEQIRIGSDLYCFFVIVIVISDAIVILYFHHHLHLPSPLDHHKKRAKEPIRSTHSEHSICVWTLDNVIEKIARAYRDHAQTTDQRQIERSNGSELNTTHHISSRISKDYLCVFFFFFLLISGVSV